MLCLAHEDLETDELVSVVCVRCKLLLLLVMRKVLLLSVSGEMRGRRRRRRRGRVGRGPRGLGVCDEKIEERVCDIFGRTIQDQHTFRKKDESGTVKVLSCRLVCPLPIQMLIEHRGQFGTARLSFVSC